MNLQETISAIEVLPAVYLLTIELHRQKGDRAKIIEYGEKTLKLDQGNVTAMMILTRNYAIEGTNLDRAVDLAQQAVDHIGKMRAQGTSSQYTEAESGTIISRTPKRRHEVFWITRKASRGTHHRIEDCR